MAAGRAQVFVREILEIRILDESVKRGKDDAGGDDEGQHEDADHGRPVAGESADGVLPEGAAGFEGNVGHGEAGGDFSGWHEAGD
jgi:hypothetical protein